MTTATQHSPSEVLAYLRELVGRNNDRTAHAIRNSERFRRGAIPSNAVSFNKDESDIIVVCETMLADAKMYDDVKYAAMGISPSATSGALTQEEVDAYERYIALTEVSVSHSVEEIDDVVDDFVIDLCPAAMRRMIAISLLIDDIERIESRSKLHEAPTVDINHNKRTGVTTYNANGVAYRTFIEAVTAAVNAANNA